MSEKRKTCGELSGNKSRSGSLCGAWPLKGRKVCLSHADADTRASVGFVAEAGKLGGRPRIPTATEVMQQLVEENVAVILRPHFAVLGYGLEVVADAELGQRIVLVPLEEGAAKLYGESRDGVVRMSSHEDLGAQLAAAEKILDRACGRPKQATELSGPGGKPLEVDVQAVPSEADFHTEVAGILAAAGATGSDGDGG